MTQTLTTDLVDATPDEWFEALSQSPDLCAGLTVDVIQRMAARLAKLMRAANREAQPVGFYTTVSGKSGVIWHNGAPDDDTAIYTAPPAQAVVKLPTEFYSDEGVVVRLEEVMAALALVGVKYERKGNACRAAMLAQPQIEQQNIQNNIPDGLAAAVNRLLDSDGSRGCFSAVRSYDAREEIERRLAAAPEGGN